MSLRPKLVWAEDRWIFICRYEERLIPQAAGMQWDPYERVWYTRHGSVASRLESYIDEAMPVPRPIRRKASPPMPDGTKLDEFQREGVAHALDTPRCLIADEMGLGKTVQAIAVMNTLPPMSSILIGCPTNLSLNWMRELERFLVHPVDASIATSKGLPSTRIVILPYSIAAKLAGEVRKHAPWSLVVLDEAHYLKNPKAQRTRAIYGYGRGVRPLKAERVIAMTGTPILNRPVELFSMLRYLSPDAWGNWHEYVYRYCAATRNHFGLDTSGASNLIELNTKLVDGVMIRRLKQDVLHELPPKRRQVIEVDPKGEQRKVVKAEAESFDRLPHEVRAAIMDLSDGPTLTMGLAEMAKERQAVALAKVGLVAEHVESLMEQTNKVVVFAHHHGVIDGLRQLLAAEDREVFVYDGRMNAQEKDAADTGFRLSTRSIFIGSIEAAGTGLNLQSASTVVFAEMSWVPGSMAQAEDRLHRRGQHDGVLVQHVVLAGSMDSHMSRVLVTKQDVTDAAADGRGV